MKMWKPVVGYEGLYDISSSGDIRRTARGKLFNAGQIENAKQMFHKGATLKQVAEFLNTSITTAHSIKKEKTWKGNAEFRPVKTKIGSDFYVYFTPSKDGVYRHRPIHRCIWEAFVGPIEGRLEINHKNLDRQDNRLENLELVTHQQNIKHAIDRYKSKGLLRSIKGVKGFIKGKHSEYD